MGAGAEIDELAIPIVRDGFALGNGLEQVQFELAWDGALGEGTEPAGLGVADGLVAGDDRPFEDLVGFDDLFHLGLDGGEIIGRDAVSEFDIVVEPGFDRRAVGELGLGPKPGDGGGHDVGAGVTQPLEVGHLLALIERFAVLLGWIGFHKD
jgi:hypothetical protein